MPFIRSLAVALLALGALGGTANAQPKQEKLDLILNWVPGGDHVPYYYAKKMGWYRDAGIDLNIEPGKGSALAVQKVGAGANQIGLADMANALRRAARAPTRSACSTSTPTRRRACTGSRAPASSR
jgi:NitT/TauT family transport system substrate-binding protein